MLAYLPIDHRSFDGSSRNTMRVNILRYIINNHSDGSWFRTRDFNQFCAFDQSKPGTANVGTSQLIVRLNKRYACFDAEGQTGKYKINDLHTVKTLLCKAERAHSYAESFDILPKPYRIIKLEERERQREYKRMARESKPQHVKSPEWIRDTSSIIFNLGG